MDVYFLDASAVVKRYVLEAGSGWVRALTDPASGNSLWLAAITRVEVVAALHLRARAGTLTALQARQAESAFRHELNTHFQRLNLSAGVLNHAMDLAAAHQLRAYDAVQLAAVLRLHAQQAAQGLPFPVLVSADRHLNRAAAAEGLSVDDPNSHP